MYSSVIGNVSCIRNTLSRLSSSLTIWKMSQGLPAFSFFSIICLYLSIRLDNGIIQYIPCTGIFKTVIMRPVSYLIPFKIRVRHIFKKLVLNNIKACFLHLLVLIMEKVPRLTAKDYTFNPTIYIPHIGQW